MDLFHGEIFVCSIIPTAFNMEQIEYAPELQMDGHLELEWLRIKNSIIWHS